MAINVMKKAPATVDTLVDVETIADLNDVLIDTLMAHRRGEISADSAKATAMVAGRISNNTALAFRYGTNDGDMSTIRVRRRRA